MILLICTLWCIYFQLTNGNYFFVTHNSYEGVTLDGTSFTTMRILGNNNTVTQQCRRACALDPNCKAHEVELLQGALPLGTFECRLHSLNLCDWQFVSLQNATTRFVKVWDKLSGSRMKPKPCAEYCGVKYKGDCQACRNSANFSGLECDEPPRLCSDLVLPLIDNWDNYYTVWPWGFNGPPLKVRCQGKKTMMLQISNDMNTNTRYVYSLGWLGLIPAKSLADFETMIDNISWPLISEIQAISIEKKLHLRVIVDTNGPNERTYNGFRISSNGTLSLSGIVGSHSYPGFYTPVNNAPFVKNAVNYNFTCGHFWKLSNDSICKQNIRLVNYEKLVWGGRVSDRLGTAIFSFT